MEQALLQETRMIPNEISPGRYRALLRDIDARYEGRPHTARSNEELLRFMEAFLRKRRKGQVAIREMITGECYARTAKYPKVLKLRDHSEFVADPVLREVLSIEDYTQNTSPTLEAIGVLRDDESLLSLRAVYDFVAHRLIEESDSPNWFEIAEDLAYCFMATDLKGVTGADVHVPFRSFVLSFPRGVMRLLSNTGEHAVEALGVFLANPLPETSARGDGLLVMAWGGPGTHGGLTDNQTSHVFSPLRDDMDLDAAFESVILDELGQRELWAAHERVAKIGDRVLNMTDFRSFVMRYVINALLYISGQERLVRKHEAEISSIRAKGKKVRKVEAERLKRFEADNTYVVETKVALHAAEFRDAVIASGGQTHQWSLKYKTLVRGHWRNQPIGKGRQQRKLIFIAPHSRGGNLPEQVAAAHTYQVS